MKYHHASDTLLLIFVLAVLVMPEPIGRNLGLLVRAFNAAAWGGP